MIIGRKAEAWVETSRATRYLTQLCKHFAHEAEARPVRVRVEYDDHEGATDFGWVGTCTMQAHTDGLRLRVAAGDPIRLRLLQRVVASHLERFGRRDELHVQWRRARAS